MSQNTPLRKLNLYTFHRGIAPYRFDNHNTQHLLEALKDKYDVSWHNLDGADNFIYQNDCHIKIDQGSIIIFEFDDTREFRTFDFGDAPTLTVALSRSKNFRGAAIGQYNKQLWDEVITDPILRANIVPSIYPETCWSFGVENYDSVQEYRKATDLDKRLYWRGSIYKDPNRVEYDRRIAVEYVAQQLSNNFYFGHFPVQFDQYIQEALQFKLALCFGVGGGYACGDFCLRDIEFYGLGIPTIRPVYAAQTKDPLIPNVHYIAVDCEFDTTFRYQNPQELANKIVSRYKEVINDDRLLQEVAYNARKWYINNITSPNITTTILNTLQL
jgi:hypothetical protein